MDTLQDPGDHCDACERRDNIGYHSEALARQVTSQVARGHAHPYYLVQSHTGLWYFVRSTSVDGRLGTSYATSLTRNAAICATIEYMGGKIVAKFDHKGDPVSLYRL